MQHLWTGRVALTCLFVFDQPHLFQGREHNTKVRVNFLIFGGHFSQVRKNLKCVVIPHWSVWIGVYTEPPIKRGWYVWPLHRSLHLNRWMDCQVSKLDNLTYCFLDCLGVFAVQSVDTPDYLQYLSGPVGFVFLPCGNVFFADICVWSGLLIQCVQCNSAKTTVLAAVRVNPTPAAVMLNKPTRTRALVWNCRTSCDRASGGTLPSMRICELGRWRSKASSIWSKTFLWC